MIGACPLFAAISPTTTAPSIPRRPAKPYSFHLFTGVNLSQAGPCLLAMPWRAGTLKEAMEVEMETSTAADVAEVNEFTNLVRKLEGEEVEESLEVLASQGELFGKKKKKADHLEANKYDRYKMNNGREVFEEKTYLVGVESKGTEADNFGIEESLKELAQLADTAGLLVVGTTHQNKFQMHRMIALRPPPSAIDRCPPQSAANRQPPTISCRQPPPLSTTTAIDHCYCHHQLLAIVVALFLISLYITFVLTNKK